MSVIGYSVYLHNSYTVLVPEYSQRSSNINRQSELSFTISEINSSVKGRLSDHSARRLRNYCNLLAYLAPLKPVRNKVSGQTFMFKLNFITLDVVPNLPASQDRFIKRKLLQPFLEHFKRSDNLKNYIWKAEVQARGALHFHITTDRYIHYPEIRRVWNNLQYKHGLLKEFFQRYGHHDPNSTDVHAVKSLENYAAYMVKYFSKQDNERREIEGKIWDCSNHLKKLRWPVIETGYGRYREIDQVYDKLKPNIREEPYFTIITHAKKEEFTQLPARWQKVLKSWQSQEQINNYMRE